MAKMHRILSVVAVALTCFSPVDSFGVGLSARSTCKASTVSEGCSMSVSRRPSLARLFMSTVNAGVDAEVGLGRDNFGRNDGGRPFVPTRDVLAELDSLDDVLGIDTGEDEEQNLIPKQADLNKVAVQAALRKWQKHENDYGSSPAQIAMLTEKIIYLTKHMQKNPHDFHSRRGLIMMVNRRRKNLNYYYTQEPSRCLNMCKTLGIRFKPKSKIRGREQRYAAFKNTKSKIGTARRTEIINKEREEIRKVVEAKKQAAKDASRAEKMAKRQEAKARAAAQRESDGAGEES